jgi:hypothetical protein
MRNHTSTESLQHNTPAYHAHKTTPHIYPPPSRPTKAYNMLWIGIRCHMTSSLMERHTYLSLYDFLCVDASAFFGDILRFTGGHRHPESS